MEIHRPSARRGSWWPKSDFIFCLFTWNISINMLWKTPHHLYKHGVLFLVPYLFGIMLIAYPLMYLEISLGQFASKGMLSVWDCCPLLRGVGYAAFLMLALVLCYNLVYAAWSLHYLAVTIISPTNKFPWTVCDQAWNTPSCKDAAALFNDTLRSSSDVSPAREYFNNQFLKISSGIDEIGKIQLELMIALVVVWILVYFALVVGHYSLGKVAYATVILPVVLIIILAVRGATLPGSLRGLEYMFYPRVDFPPSDAIMMVQNAFSTVLYQYSPMFGAYAMMGSYNKEYYNFYRDSIIVVVFSSLLPIICAVFVGGMVGYYAHFVGTDINEVIQSGPNLAFDLLTAAFSTVPVPKLWLCLHYLCTIIMLFGPNVIATESLITAVSDQAFSTKLGRRTRAVLKSMMTFLACGIFFAVGVSTVTQGGQYVIILLDSTVTIFVAPLLGLFGTAAVIWIYGISAYSSDVGSMLGYKPNYFLLGCLLVLTPLFLLASFVLTCMSYDPVLRFEASYVYPNWATAIGFVLALISVLMIPLLAIIHIVKIAFKKVPMDSPGVCKRLVEPTPSWKGDVPTPPSTPTTPGGGRQVYPSSPRHLHAQDKSYIYPVVLESRA